MLEYWNGGPMIESVLSITSLHDSNNPFNVIPLFQFPLFYYSIIPFPHLSSRRHRRAVSDHLYSSVALRF